MPEPENFSPRSEPEGEIAEPEAVESTEAEATLPAFQPLRVLAALLLTAAGFGLHQYVLLSFWSSPVMGIHERIPYPAYALLGLALVLVLAGLRAGLEIWSPHIKLAVLILALLAGVVVGATGTKFVSYTLRGTLNPDFTLHLKAGDRFPPFALLDQTGAVHRGLTGRTLVVVYRGDFCPFARYELAELTAHRDQFARRGIGVIAISADPIARTRMLARFLATDIPLLSDSGEALLGPMGLIQHHRDGQPDNAIPAFFVLDRDRMVRWVFTSPYYREMPPLASLLNAAARDKPARESAGQARTVSGTGRD